MKLYTEEQIAKAVMFGRWGGTMKKDYKEFLNKLTPIELASSQTEISDIDKKIKNIYDEYSLVEVDSSLISKTFYNGIEKGYKKCLEDMSQTEISDEEIEKFFNEELKSDEARMFAKGGAKWYREQLKKKQ